ncbi:MAG: SLBB domain-containing protein [Bacteroidaceae bacterium]|nr:SLBB domain-containing protein [Bacteroidaceae bacterium]
MMKRFLFLVMVSIFSLASFAQVISDDKVLEIIITEKDKGSSEQEIAKTLLKQGVTPEQLQRVKSKVSSSRAANENASEAGTLRRERVDGADIADEPATAEPATTNTAVDTEDMVFGRNIFNRENLTFAPSMNVPTPADYVLGAGDAVIIDVWGASQFNVKETISPDGKVFLDGVGPIYLSGLTVSQAERRIKEGFGDVYSDSQVSLSLGSVRSIQVQVLGEVAVPGTYTISAFSTAFNALYAAGGINDMGTLRSIKVYRAGKEISEIDVYEYILNGKTTADVRLRDNDIISVGAYNNIVKISGKVKRAMKYEMKEGETLLDAISYAGGFTGDAYTENINVTRKSGREYSMHTVSKPEAAAFAIKDGDAVIVEGMLPRFSNMIEISGAVFYPGLYELGDKISTVSELIAAAGGVVEEAFLDRAVLQHRNFDKSIETVSLDLKGILDGTAADVALKNNDLLFIPNSAEMLGDQFMTISGEVNLPGKYKFAKNTTVEDLILQAGGLTRAASVMKVDIYRNILDPENTEFTEQMSKAYTISLKDGLVAEGGENFVLEPFDYVVVRRTPSYSEIQEVRINGCVNYEGSYVLPSKNYRLSDLVSDAGGFTTLAYIKGASLRRRMTPDERKQRETTMKTTQIQMLEESLRDDDKELNLALLDSLMNLKLNLGEVYPVAIDLEEAMENPGSFSDLVLRDGDVLNIPQQAYTIRVSGEVRHPITLSYEKKKSVKYYIKHAGGYSNKAKKSGVYIVYMNGDVVNVSKNSKKAVEPGCEIVVPRSSSSGKLSPTEMATIGTSTASIATMIVAIINLLK